MPPQTIDTIAAPQTKSSKGFLGFMKASNGRWIGQSTVRSLGHTWSSNTRGSARRPVWE